MNETPNADLQVYNNVVMLMTKLSKFIHNIQFDIYNKKQECIFMEFLLLHVFNEKWMNEFYIKIQKKL